MNEPMTHFMQRYHQLCALRAAGQLHPQQFMAEVQQLRWQDARGDWWMIDPNGIVLRYDGQRWLPIQPQPANPRPRSPATPPRPAPSPSPARPGSTTPTPVTTSALLRTLAPILPIAPAVLCGGLWFLYTFIGLLKAEGIGGVDWLTPLIVGGLPIMFWLFKKPLDQLLLPLKPHIQSVPKPVRLGICLAIPVFLGCGCSVLTYGGYFALSVAAFISVMTAGLLMRY